MENTHFEINSYVRPLCFSVCTCQVSTTSILAVAIHNNFHHIVIQILSYLLIQTIWRSTYTYHRIGSLWLVSTYISTYIICMWHWMGKLSPCRVEISIKIRRHLICAYAHLNVTGRNVCSCSLDITGREDLRRCSLDGSEHRHTVDNLTADFHLTSQATLVFVYIL